MNKDNGGPAFPVAGFEYLSEQHDERIVYQPSGGMTLRDYFAAKAMQGLLTRPGSVNPRQDAEFSYMLADAMLEARKQ